MDGRRGLTLLEVMVVLLILGIIAAIAIPSYTHYVKRARRADAFNALLALHAAQEAYKAEHGCYGDFGQLPGCSPNMAGENYVISLNISSNGTSYNATAIPQGRQRGDYCLRIDQDGKQYYAPSLDGICGTFTEKKFSELR